MVMAQLVERSLPTLETGGSNPVIGKINLLSINKNCIEKTKIKKKEVGKGTFKNYFCIKLFEENTNAKKKETFLNN